MACDRVEKGGETASVVFEFAEVKLLLSGE